MTAGSLHFLRFSLAFDKLSLWNSRFSGCCKLGRSVWD